MPSLAFTQLQDDLPILSIEEIETEYYLRISVLDKVGVIAKITRVLGDFDINIEALIQKEPQSSAVESVPVVLLTDTVLESQMNQAIKAIEQLQEVTGKVTLIRVESLDSEESE